MKSAILVVDDDPDYRFMICEMLSVLGFASLQARDGVEAIEVALREQPTLILMDLVMPRLNGFDAINGLQQFELTRHIPVVILSSMTDVLTQRPAAVIAMLCKGSVNLSDLRQMVSLARAGRV